MNTSNRRSEPRKLADLSCRFCHMEKWEQAKVIDLSSQGAFLESAAIPCDGDLINIKLEDLKSQGSMDIQAITVYSGRFLQQHRNFRGFGVRFEAGPEHPVLRLDELLAESTEVEEERYEFEV